MPFLTSPIMPMPLARSVAITALMGATMLAGPLTSAWADTTTNAAIQLAQAAQPVAAQAAETKTETVEQRITELHTAMKITPDQEQLWKGVAQDMRVARRSGWEDGANQDENPGVATSV